MSSDLGAAPFRAIEGRLWAHEDERLTVSPDVMALLETDFPDAARQFQVDPIVAEYERYPMRWVVGFDEAVEYLDQMRADVEALAAKTHLPTHLLPPEGLQEQINQLVQNQREAARGVVPVRYVTGLQEDET